ncbi:YbaY family lipoprotein [Luteimonas sp. TWI1416]|uniref:YbaY family lipoprotein n=1 Tax=unclassified Luteimonas TaxID=2629088 RepID=UPI003208D1E4
MSPTRPVLVFARIAAAALSVALLGACQTPAPTVAAGAPSMTDTMPQPSLTLQGEAVYFEKILMPEGSRLDVRLVDPARTGEARVLAERSTSVGAGPYAFELVVPRARLQGAVALEIAVSMPDGTPRFRTEDAVPIAIDPANVGVHVGRVRLHHVQP